MKQFKLIMIGAGGRGMHAYAPYLLNHPEEGKFVGVAEPISTRREEFAKTYGVSEDCCFEDWHELVEKVDADAAIICTQDNGHVEPAIACLKAGMHVMLEKPVDKNPVKCGELVKTAEETGKICAVCHVLRYAPFFNIIKTVIDSGDIGKVMSLELCENVGFWHMAHSYVRGLWHSEKDTSPMIMAKSCHDMDIILYLLGKNCEKLSSFGSLSYFKRENAPENSGERCLDCAAESQCPYSAKKIYLNMKSTHWPINVISEDISYEGRIKALETTDYGKCVFKCDNDVVDHQVVAMEFEDGITATFTMSAFTAHLRGREIHIMGTLGEIHAFMGENMVHVYDFNTKTQKDIPVVIDKDNSFGHGGGDAGITKSFLAAMRGESGVSSDIRHSIQSHIMCVAAEQSRKENTVVDINRLMDKYCK